MKSMSRVNSQALRSEHATGARMIVTIAKIVVEIAIPHHILRNNGSFCTNRQSKASRLALTEYKQRI